MEIDELKEGQTCYVYTKSLGLIKYKIISVNSDNVCVEVNGEIKPKPFSNTQVWSPTQEEAMIRYYKRRQSVILNKIKDIKKKLNTTENELNELKSEYKFLEEEFPEHFL